MEVLGWLRDLVRRVLGKGIFFRIEKEIAWTGYTNPDPVKPKSTPDTDPVTKPYTRETFLKVIQPNALQIQEEHGIPWLFAACQAAHESRNGNSRLTVEANNLFGITGDTWYVQGKPVYWIETKEYSKDKVPFIIRRPFRKYDSWLESLRDWAGLIRRRYDASYQAALASDFDGFAKGLQAGGYATDPTYAKKLTESYSGFVQIAKGMSQSKDA